MSSTTDEKLKTASASNNTTYYPVFGTSTSDAETKFKDTNGFKYITQSSTGESLLILGNGASGTSNSRCGAIELYGTTTYSTLLIPTESSTAILLYGKNLMGVCGNEENFVEIKSGSFDVLPSSFSSINCREPKGLKRKLSSCILSMLNFKSGTTVNFVSFFPSAFRLKARPTITARARHPFLSLDLFMFLLLFHTT